MVDRWWVVERGVYCWVDSWVVVDWMVGSWGMVDRGMYCWVDSWGVVN